MKIIAETCVLSLIMDNQFTEEPDRLKISLILMEDIPTNTSSMRNSSLEFQMNIQPKKPVQSSVLELLCMTH